MVAGLRGVASRKLSISFTGVPALPVLQAWVRPTLQQHLYCGRVEVP